MKRWSMWKTGFSINDLQLPCHSRWTKSMPAETMKIWKRLVLNECNVNKGQGKPEAITGER